MSKVDLEDSYVAYGEAVALAELHTSADRLQAAVNAAKQALPQVDGKLKYEKRYLGGVTEVRAIEIICDLAPLVLDYRALRELSAFVNENRGVERSSSECLADSLEDGQRRLAAFHRFWIALANEGRVSAERMQRLLAMDEREADAVQQKLRSSGLIVHDGGFVHAVTRLGAMTRAKCASCGRVSEAPKAFWFEAMRCPLCGRHSEFVITE